MRFWLRFPFCAVAVLLGAALAGCAPGQGSSDDEKEPHFVLGMSRVNAMDYQGAVEAFEESLEADPHSAAAHFQLGMLYEEKVPDPAAAIYHYERYLKLEPDAANAALIKQHIDVCKQQLAAGVLGLPSTSAAQQQLARLADQNRELQQEVDRLTETVRQWNAYYASQLAARSNTAAQSDLAARQAAGSGPDDRPARAVTAPSRVQDNAALAKPVRPRTHIVAARETAMGICRETGVKFGALQAANPGVNLSRIRAGQVLNLPPP